MAQVLVVPDVADPRVGECRRYTCRVVWRTVVHYKNFKVMIGLRQYGGNTFWKQMRQSVARDYEANRWIIHCILTWRGVAAAAILPGTPLRTSTPLRTAMPP